MKRPHLHLILALAALAPLVSGAANHTPADFVRLKPVPFTEVKIADDFWAPRCETNRLYTIPINFENLEKSGNLQNLRLAAQGATDGYTRAGFHGLGRL